MGFKENLKAKIRLDMFFREALRSVKEPPGARWVDKDVTKGILELTDFEYRKVRNLDLYTRRMENDQMEVLVLDNELPIYHTSLGDVTLRKSPHWQEVFSIKNIRKIMNDQDVIVSRGKESLKSLHANALSRLDLSYTRNDLEVLIEDGRKGLERGSAEETRESLDLFFELLGFEPVYFDVLEPDLHLFGRPVPGRDETPSFEHLILFNQEDLFLGLKKGVVSPANEMDLAWVIGYAERLEKPDLQGTEVFKFLSELALQQRQPVPPLSGEPQDEMRIH